MSNELETTEEKIELEIAKEPEEVLIEAQRAAQALTKVIAQKPKKVIINNEQYIEFEDWQTVAKFYGVTAKVTESKYTELGEAKGFEARAVAISTKTGLELSAGEALCLNDEANWKNKPMFQLKSMAQTRACGKALRNCLAWVVVLAGFRPTPAEEMQTEISKSEAKMVTEPQLKKIHAMMNERHIEKEDLKIFCKAKYGVESSKELTLSQASNLIEEMAGWPDYALKKEKALD